MHWLDIVFIVVIIVFALVGMSKGFLASIISLFSIIVTIVLVVWLAPGFTNMIDGWFGGGITSFFTNQMTGIVNDFGGTAVGTVLTDATPASTLIEGFTGLNGIFKTLLQAITSGATLEVGTDVTEWFAASLGAFVTVLCGAVVLFIIFRIALALLAKLFDNMTENRTVNGLDRVLGFALGLIKGLFLLAVLIAVLKLFTILGPINDFVTEWLSKTSLLRDFANWIYEMIDKLLASIDFNALIGRIFNP